MSGRHGSWQVRAWAPTALSAVIALVPAGALLAAVGAAGSGYLLHRADLAAAGAGVAAAGLAAERLQTRLARRRVRRERWEHRQEEQGWQVEIERLHQELADAHYTLTVLRSRIVTLTERAAAGGRPTLTELAARQRLAREAAYGDVPTMQLRRITPAEPAAAPATSQAGLPANPLMPRPMTAAVPAVAVPAAEPVVTGRPTPAQTERRRPVVTLGRSDALPGWRSAVPAVPAVPAALAGRVPSMPVMPVMPGRPDAARPAVAAPAAQRMVSAPAPAAGPVSAPAPAVGPVSAPAPAVGPVSAPAPAVGPATGPLPVRPITLGPLSPAPQLPALPDGPAEPVTQPIPRPASAMLPPGPRDPVSGPLAILVDPGAGLPRPRSNAASAPTVDAMVYAALAEARADELTRTLEQPGDPDRSGRHLGLADWDERTPSGLVIVGASTVGDPQARARRGRHSA